MAAIGSISLKQRLAAAQAALTEPERAFALAVAALSLAVAWQAGGFVWAIAAPIGPVGAATAPVSARAASVDYAALVQSDPFFRAASSGTEPSSDPSQLGLALFAIRAGGSDGGAAIIQIPGRGQRSISIGEEVAAGVVLRAITADAALLERNGQTFELRFPNTPAATAPEDVAAAPATAQGDALLRVATTIDPAALLAELALQARIENGEVTGYTLRDGRDGPTLRRVGLQPGDVLLEVNNRRLADDERVAELQQELMSRPEAVIRFERNGEVRTATVRIAQP